MKGCACIGSWIWIEFAICYKFLSETSRCVDYTLPVKMCGTHLGVIVSVVSVGSVNHLLRCAAHTLGQDERNMSFVLVLNGWLPLDHPAAL